MWLLVWQIFLIILQRDKLFITELHHRDAESSKRRKLKDLCKTRWVERHDAFEVFMELYESTVCCLEEIVDRTAENAWNRENVSDARSHLRAPTEFKYTLYHQKHIGIHQRS